MKTYDVIELLEKTQSTNEKKKILENLTGQLKDNIKNIFLWTYNPKVNYFIKKIDKNLKEGSADFDEDIDGDISSIIELFIDLSHRIITGNQAKETVKTTLECFNKKSQDLIIKILTRDLRCNVTEKIVNKVWDNWIPVFDVQLANTFDPENTRESEYYVSRKMDGLRGIYIPNEGLYTRQGKKILGFENTIEKDMFDFCSKNGMCCLDGELFSTDIPFEKIQSAVMSNKNIDEDEKKFIKFNAFAAIKDFWKKEIFSTTKEMIDLIYTIKGYSYLDIVETKLVPVEDVDRIHDEYVKEGYEGIMLRHPMISYEFKRGNGLLKFKKFFESDFEIVDMFEGNGKYQGSLGGIKVRGEIDGKVIESEVGSGFNDEQRSEMWNDKTIIGRKAEVKYQGITPDNSLRFPVFNKLKLDR